MYSRFIFICIYDILHSYYNDLPVASIRCAYPVKGCGKRKGQVVSSPSVAVVVVAPVKKWGRKKNNRKNGGTKRKRTKMKGEEKSESTGWKGWSLEYLSCLVRAATNSNHPLPSLRRDSPRCKLFFHSFFFSCCIIFYFPSLRPARSMSVT